MPKPWTTKEQLAWLTLRKSDFLDAQKKKSTGRFLTLVTEQWFVVFPEFDSCFPDKERSSQLTTNEEETLKNAIIKRKDRIENWFFWHTKGHKSPRGNVISQYMKVIKARTKKKLRAPQDSEVYMKLYNTKCMEAYQLRSYNVSTGAQKANIMRALAKELLMNETEEVKGKVKAAVQKRRGEIVQQLKDAHDEEDCKSKTPAEFQRAIDESSSFLDAAMQSYVAATGFEVFVCVGGPVPENKGQISVEQYHYGPHTPAGSDFGQSFVKYGEMVDGFTKHVFKCFPEHIRTARSLFNHSADEEEGEAARDKRMDDGEKGDERDGDSDSGKEVGSDDEKEDGSDDDEGDAGDVEDRPSKVGKKTAAQTLNADRLYKMPNRADSTQPNGDQTTTLDPLAGLDVPTGAPTTLLPAETTPMPGSQGAESVSIQQDAPPLRYSIAAASAPGGPTEPYERAFERMTIQHAPARLEPLPVIQPSNIDPEILRIDDAMQRERAGNTGITLAGVKDAKNREVIAERPLEEEAANGRKKVGRASAAGNKKGQPKEDVSRGRGKKASMEVEVEADQAETIATGRGRREIKAPRRPDGELRSPIKASKRKASGIEATAGKENRTAAKRARK
ncbi:hypothetical protein CPC08DRAFT_730496 [Agrocybe pediades]|nr:hypothetical protein CPC08DRAFT_730496 [Agrocybe pediades]